MSKKQELIIVGPCAGENKKQISQTIQWASEQPNVCGTRGNLWKPRTGPGFEGHGTKVFNWMMDAIRTTQAIDLILSTEVIIPEHVTTIAQQIDKLTTKAPKMILWLGSRNQNHFIQREIAKRIKEEMPQSTRLMIKNQPWRHNPHWPGIVEHVNTHLPTDRLLLCHRGFDPGNDDNPAKLRNMPDWEEAMRIRELTDLPMLNDPSHQGGSVENVIAVFAQSLQLDFDGHLIEAHPNPAMAITDKNQQLTLEQAGSMISGTQT